MAYKCIKTEMRPLRYGFSQYSEPRIGNVNNFTANGVFATLSYKWP